ncbi:major facilitator superfamily domain-containing protein [Catenaria anguillulae PL171]|uniref:Major facilitator superfamily domain-containing protein n=1 Tax=Catenaria anguillulae PL171 TaxID=765915 RepID=A0A1Y2HAD0_9FUNG|nr:major facilitator superfamily domain-containing protein [Catenaria anguillulae PL171]
MAGTSLSNPNKKAGWLERHFTDSRRRASPEQMEREAYIYGNVPFKRWLLIPASVMIQLAAGSFYAWSVYNAPITKRLNEGNDQDIHAELISETFYAAVASFGLACFLCGPWLERHGPRRMTMIGATLFFIGQMITVLAMHVQSVPLLFIGYGAIVSVLQQWYPESKGFSAGVAVGSFGLGSVIASFTQSALIEAMGVMGTFLVLGCTYFVVQMLSALVMRFPPPDLMAADSVKNQIAKSGLTSPAGMPGQHHDEETADAHHHNSSGATVTNVDGSEQVPMTRQRRNSIATSVHTIENVDEFMQEIKSVDYRFIYIIFFLSVIPGLVLVSRVADMVQSAFKMPTSTSTWVVGVNGGFNVIGRFAIGALSDKVPRFGLLMSCMILSIGAMVAMYISLSNLMFELFIASMWMLTGLYGGACAVVPGILGAVFGSRHISGLYGAAMTAWAAGGVIGGVGFTALIKGQRQAGVAANHVYDLCLYSMIPLAALGCVILTLFMIRRRKIKANSKPVQTHAH